MEILEQMGSRIQALRKEKSVTQAAMAKLLGVTPNHYQKIEYGKVNIQVSTLRTLADYFEVSTDYLLGRTDAPHRPPQ